MQVIQKGEVWTENGLEFHHTQLILQEEDDFFYANVQHRSCEEIDTNTLDVHPIPIEDIWPPFHADFTPVSHPLSDNCYIKRPCLLGYEPGDEVRICDVLLEEARTCEILRKNLHPNIAQYLGCVVQGGRINGLCFLKYNMTLADRLKDHDRLLDADKFWNGIKDGVEHLHSLGIIHNDLNPRNVMLDSNDTPVIIDFDSCRREGEKLLKAGTFGWTEWTSEIAARQNDYDDLEKIHQALREHFG